MRHLYSLKHLLGAHSVLGPGWTQNPQWKADDPLPCSSSPAELTEQDSGANTQDGKQLETGLLRGKKKKKYKVTVCWGIAEVSCRKL